MSIATQLARRQADLVKLDAAYEAALNAQRYGAGSVEKQMAELASIDKMRKECETDIEALEAGRYPRQIKPFRIVTRP